MDFAPDLDAFIRFILLVFPGMLAMRIYRMMKCARDLEWKDALIESVFFSVVNFMVCLPILSVIGSEGFSARHPMVFSFALMAMVLVTPIILAYVYVKLLNTRLTKGLMMHHTTALDYYFEKRQPCFILVHLKDGKNVGGYFSDRSFAASSPRHGDLYIEHVYQFDQETKTFSGAIEGSAGLLVRAEDYNLLEFFRIPDHSSKQGEKK